MSNRAHLKDLMIHMEWADSSIWEVVFARESVDSRVFDCLHHIHLVQHAFLSLWRGDPLDLSEPSHFAGTTALAQWGREGHIEIQRYVASVEPATLDQVLEIPWTEELTKRLKGPIDSVSVEQSMLQVSMHSLHHRGQIALLLRDLGGEPPMIDYIVWLWQGRPQAEWTTLGAE